MQSKRLLIRPYHPNDWEAVYAFRSDGDALKYEPWGPDSAAYVRQILNDAQRPIQAALTGEYEWAVTLQESGQVIGGCKLVLPIPSHQKWGWATVGYVIQRRFWGQGLATEALRCLIDFAQQQPYVIGVDAICDSHNVASLRVLEKCGLICVGMIAETEEVKGRFRDMLQYQRVFKRW